MDVRVRFINPETDEVEIRTYEPADFDEIQYHDLFDDDTAEIIGSSPSGIDDLGSLDDLSRYVDAIGESAVEAWIANHHGYNGEDLENVYYGEYSSLADFGRDVADNQGIIPEEFDIYIDWDAYGDDLRQEFEVLDDVSTGGVYVFIIS